ncbi:MAG: hypothetical protein L3K19_03335 [Thermoplasmata archaeon]|nr:hypothetical protein [Thermoplasmata archaeon]
MPYPEMVSGPDLGGGFLHQLTRERSGDLVQFVFHAQEGGQDAGGPPKGSPEPLGWSRPGSSCQFGGPRCWHREFELPIDQESQVRAAYNRTRFVFEAQMAQLYGGMEPPVHETLKEVVARIGPALEQLSTPWHVGGSAAALLQGVPIRCQDLDLGTTMAGVRAIGDALSEYLIEPVSPTTWVPGHRVLGGRAFVGTLARGMRVEWATQLEAAPAGPYDLEWRMPEEKLPVRSVTVEGQALRVSRLEFAFARAFIQHRPERVSAIANRLREEGPDLRLLHEIFEGAGVDRTAWREAEGMLAGPSVPHVGAGESSPSAAS